MKFALAFLLFSLVALPVFAAETFAFKSGRKPGATDRVSVRLEVAGKIKFSENGKQESEKLGVDCTLEYLENNLENSGDGESHSVRDYRKIAAVVKVGDGEFKPTLRPDRRLICAEAGKKNASLFSLVGNLTYDELDAIDIQGNSILLDRLLPDKPVAVGQSWELPGDLWAAMLGLDEVAKTSVKNTFKEATEKLARFEFAGKVEGAVYGVSTTVELKGRYRLDRRTNRIDWLGMVIKENRESSFIADGIEAVSRLQATVVPSPEDDAASLGVAARDAAERFAPDSLRLEFESPAGDWRIDCDRRWHIHRQRPKSSAAVLRFLDRGALTAQCNVSSLAKQDPEKLISLEDFQADIRKALGKNFGEFVEAGQASNDADYRVYRVVVHGTASDLEMRWIYYLIADRHGRQASLAFIVEQKLADDFAGADREIVKSLRFIDR